MCLVLREPPPQLNRTFEVRKSLKHITKLESDSLFTKFTNTSSRILIQNLHLHTTPIHINYEHNKGKGGGPKFYLAFTLNDPNRWYITILMYSWLTTKIIFKMNIYIKTNMPIISLSYYTHTHTHNYFLEISLIIQSSKFNWIRPTP